MSRFHRLFGRHGTSSPASPAPDAGESLTYKLLVSRDDLDGGFTTRVEGLPIFSQGETLEEAVQSTVRATITYLEYIHPKSTVTLQSFGMDTSGTSTPVEPEELGPQGRELHLLVAS